MVQFACSPKLKLWQTGNSPLFSFWDGPLPFRVIVCRIISSGTSRPRPGSRKRIPRAQWRQSGVTGSGGRALPDIRCAPDLRRSPSRMSRCPVMLRPVPPAAAASIRRKAACAATARKAATGPRANDHCGAVRNGSQQE